MLHFRRRSAWRCCCCDATCYDAVQHDGPNIPPPFTDGSLCHSPCHRFVFYETVDMRALRPLEQTQQLHPAVKSLEAWLGEHRAAFEQLFGAE